MSQRDRHHHQNSSQPTRQKTTAADSQDKIERPKKNTKITNLFKRSASATASSSPTRNAQRSDPDRSSRRNIPMSQPASNIEKGEVSPTSFSQPTISLSQSRSENQHKPKINNNYQNKKSKIRQEPVYKNSFITPIKESPVKKRRYREDDEEEGEYREQSESFQVALPASDSPIIRRNKEMRESSNRRSSLGMRGKRASSIGNGFSTMPHDTIPTEDFYKHIDQDLPDPQKMRQLLSWCSKRILEEDKRKHIKQKNILPHDELTVLNIAKVIKEELVKDLTEGKIQTSWWGEADEDENEADKNKADGSFTKKRLLPNPRNIKNAEILEELVTRRAKLEEEIDQWQKYHVDADDLKNLYKVDFDENQVKSQINDNFNEGFNRVLDNSIVNEVSNLENQSSKLIASKLEGSLDEFNDFVHTLKNAQSIRSKFTDLKSSKLTEALDSKSYDSGEKGYGNVDSRHLLQAISRLGDV